MSEILRQPARRDKSRGPPCRVTLASGPGTIGARNSFRRAILPTGNLRFFSRPLAFIRGGCSFAVRGGFLLFTNPQDPVGDHVGLDLNLSAGPSDFEPIHHAMGPQSKVQPQILRALISPARSHFIHLSSSTRSDLCHRADRTAVAAGSHQF